MGKNQYVVRHGDKWAVVGDNNSRPTRITDTQKEAMGIARTIATNQKSEMRVQDSTGKWRKCNSYGNDTCPPKDKNW